MKKWNLILIAIFLILPFGIQTRDVQDIPPVAQQIAEKIQLSIQNYKENMVPEGAALLCDAVLMTRPRDSWPEGFAEAIDSAKIRFSKGEFTEGAGNIRQAIKIFKPEQSPSSPEEDGQIGNLAQSILNKIESAVENFKIGEADKAVLLILESLTLLAPLL